MEEAIARARALLGTNADDNQILTIAKELHKERREKESLVEHQVWKHGVPPLEIFGGSGTPSSSTHHAVTKVPCKFVTFKDLEWDLLHKSTLYSGNAKPNKPLKYASESDIARYSHSCLSDVLHGLKNLNGRDIELFNEYTVASLRPDLVVMITNGRPIGYCEVKKPNVIGRADRPLEDDRVLGQAYDYVMDLRYEHGVQWAFVLVTTFRHWRVVWIDDTTSRDAAALDRIDGVMGSYTPAVAADHPSIRSLCVSDVLNAEGNPAVGCFLGSVLLKMASSPVFETSVGDRLWPWISNRGMTWKKFSVTDLTTSFPSDPRPPFVRIRQLGGGRDGMCWEIGKGNSRFALKIIRQREGISTRDVASDEEKVWRAIWGIRARAIEVMGRAALVMPLVATFRSEAEFRKRLPEAKEAVRCIARLHYVHNDLRHSNGTVKWEHFGMVTNQDGAQRLIVLDLSDMEKVGSEREAIEAMHVKELFCVYADATEPKCSEDLKPP